MEDEYLVDERDAVEGEVSDSDQEFESIVEVDKLIKDLTELYESNIRNDADSVRNYHERMLILMRRMHDIIDLLEFENEDLWRVFDEIIA